MGVALHHFGSNDMTYIYAGHDRAQEMHFTVLQVFASQIRRSSTHPWHRSGA
jgi:hypothetical protein